MTSATVSQPTIGDIRKDKSSSYIWCACEVCGAQRWVRLKSGVPRCRKCIHCPSLGYTGHHHSEETRLKMSLMRKGVPKSEEWKRKIPTWRTGCRHTDEAKRKISVAAQGRPGIKWSPEMIEYFRQINIGRTHSAEIKKRIGECFRGRHHREDTKEQIRLKLMRDKNPNWRGGIGRLPYPIDFFSRELRAVIMHRDNNTCQLCGASDRLRPHHIDYIKENISENNLITLCTSCNSRVNFNRERWTIYFKERLLCQKSRHSYLEFQDKTVAT